jgi:hypothetical protein
LAAETSRYYNHSQLPDVSVVDGHLFSMTWHQGYDETLLILSWTFLYPTLQQHDEMWTGFFSFTEISMFCNIMNQQYSTKRTMMNSGKLDLCLVRWMMPMLYLTNCLNLKLWIKLLCSSHRAVFHKHILKNYKCFSKIYKLWDKSTQSVTWAYYSM